MPKPRALPRDLDQPHPDRLSDEHPRFGEIMFKHNLSITLEQEGYLDPDTGFFVFNAKTLAENGRCCAMECRHCPFKR